MTWKSVFTTAMLGMALLGGPAQAEETRWPDDLAMRLVSKQTVKTENPRSNRLDQMSKLEKRLSGLDLRVEAPELQRDEKLLLLVPATMPVSSPAGQCGW